MEQTIYITSSIIIAAIIAVLAIIRILQSSREKNNSSLKKHTSGNRALRTLAISLAVLGIVFGTERIISYSFFGTSILISVIDIIQYRRTS